MKKALAVALVGALFAGFAMAQPYFIELDLDGALGNGPDVVAANVSDYIDVSVYVHGAVSGLISSNFTICNYDGSLEFQGYVDNIGSLVSGWTITPAQDLGNGCVLMQATDFTFANPIGAFPFLQGVVTFHAAVDHSFDDIMIDLDPLASGWFNTMFLSGAFDPGFDAGVQIGTSATEETNWGAVKGLFR